MRGWGGIIVVRGSRSGDADYASVVSPCLVPLANRPLLLHALDEVAATGVEHIVVACPTSVAPAVRSALGRFPRTALIDLSDEDSDEARIVAAGNELDCGHLVVHAADALAGEELAPLLRRFHTDPADALRVSAATMLLGPDAAAGLRTIEAAGTLEQLATSLAAAGVDVRLNRVSRCWQHKPGGHGLLEGNRIALENIESSVPSSTLSDSTVHGRAVIDPSASIYRSIIRGPVVVGAGARISDAYVGPYTTVGPGAVIDGSEVEHSVLLRGSTLNHVGVRVEGTILGPESRVTRTFDVPRALHLHVGPNAVVVVS